MHPDELSNWAIIKEKFEENGTTENYYYKRACAIVGGQPDPCLLYTSPSPRDLSTSRMPSSA